MTSPFSGVKKLNDKLGLWSFFGLLILALIFTILTKFDIQGFFRDFAGLFQGDLTTKTMSLVDSIKLIIPASLIMLVIALVTAKLFINSKEASENRASYAKDFFKNGPILMYLTILAEEVFARLLFLGLLRTWLHADNTTTIILFMTGNLLWSLVHLTNYNKGKRKLVYALPAFIVGIFLGYLFIRYGFWLTFIVHLTYDFIALVGDKKQTTLGKDIVNFGYWLLVTLVLVLFMTNNHANVLNLIPWFNGSVNIDINLSQMILIYLFITSLSGLFPSLLSLDSVSTQSNQKLFKGGLFSTVFYMILGVIFLALMVLLFNWLVGLFVHDPLIRSIIVVAILTLFSTPKTGSAAANLWFFSIINIFVLVFVVSYFPFWTAILIVSLGVLVEMPPMIAGAFSKELNQIFGIPEEVTDTSLVPQIELLNKETS